MQHPSRLQPLTLSHVTRQEEPWSSDSDSGITVDSHSPPSKTTPDSGICVDQLPWNLPPPPPSVLSDDTLTSSMTSRAETSKRTVMPVTSPEESEAERQRKQDYVRNTLLEYERRKMLGEERGGNVLSKDNVNLDHSRCSPIYANPMNDLPAFPSAAGSDRRQEPASQGAANDYVPSQLIRKSRHPDHEQDDVTDTHHPVTYHDLNDHFTAGEFFPPGDEGYGTDSRSHTTGSLASPLSSSLSSLTTDSSSSLNGSQRGVGPLSGNGSTRVQPVASSGRLVIGKRGMLVKRRDLPAVERTDTVTLEDRLRALTTIQEEDPAASATNNISSQSSSPSNQRRDKADTSWRSSESAPKDSGTLSSEGQTYPEGLYSVITKQPNQPRTSTGSSRPVPRSRTEGGGGSDRMCSDGGDSNSSSLHRAVPVRIQPEGDPEPYLPSTGTGPGEDLAGHTSSGEGRRGSADSHKKPGNGEGKTEVRFKAGGGGVKLNDSGQFEIDYSYYMKASPSESNDDLNTYSPTSTRTPFSEAFREGDHMPPRRRSTPRSPQTHHLPEEDSRYSRWSDLSLHSHRDYSKPAADSEDQRRHFASIPSGQDSDEPEHVYMNVGTYEPPLRPGSLPNLNIHVPLHHRRHSGDSCHQEPLRHSQDGGPHKSILRRNHAPGSGYPSTGTRRTGQGDRNSCDVGSLYRQTDLSQTFPPSQGVAADRLSLNMADLPRIHEQLRATSEMLLCAGKRHQFASSSDIYKLFQGQQNQAAGFGQGRQPPHRRSFHDFTASPPLHNLAEVRSRVKANASSSSTQSQAVTSPRLSSGPLRANHNIFVPDSVGCPGFGSGRDHASSGSSRQAYSRDLDAPPPGGERDAVTLRERLERGQQFATDVIHSEDGEQLSTLV